MTQLAVAFGLAMLILMTVLGGLIVTVRAARTWSDRQRQRRAVGPRRVLLAVAAEADPTAIEALVRMPDKQWRAIEPTAFDLLGKVRGDGHAALAQVFTDRAMARRAQRHTRSFSGIRRARSADALGQLRYDPAVPQLCRLLDDRLPEVRVVAVHALGRIGDPRAARALLNSVGGRRTAPSQPVAHALYQLGAGAIPVLVDALDHPSPAVRITVLDALGLLGAAEAEQHTLDLLRSDPAPVVRQRAAATLGRIGADAAVAPLLEVTAPDQPAAVRATAVRALGDLRVRATVDNQAALLADPTHLVAHSAAEALLQLGEPGRAALTAAAGGDGPAAPHAREALAAAALAAQRGETIGGLASTGRAG